MHFRYLEIIIIGFLLITGCKPKAGKQNEVTKSANYEVRYAKGFSVSRYTDYTEVSVRNPWDTTSLLQKYILIDRNAPMPENLPQGTIIKIPVESALAYSTIHCSSLDEIGSLGIVKGVCESEYIHIEKIKRGVEDGSIIDAGMASNPNVEKIIMLSPDVIFASPIMGQTYGNIEKTRIPIIETVDYTEPMPLGQAEWIRFYSLFTGKEQIADSLFNATVDSYNKIKESVGSVKVKRPTVVTDMKYMDSWNMPGGKSYMANMLADAGANYIWSDNDSKTFLPLTFEAVLDKGGDADFWLIKYYSPNELTYEGLKREYKPYSYFKAFKEHNIYGCNTFEYPYYIDLPIHPDYILKDFAYIFYPELFREYTPRYYKKLNN